MEDYINCFGKAEKYNSIAECKTCGYKQSCAYCVGHNLKNNRLGHVSFERYSYAKEVSTPPAIFSDDQAKDDVDLRRIMEFLLDIDNYTCELLSAVLHQNCNTTSDLARKFGVSRQAIHRKLIDTCTAHPELRSLFLVRLSRCRRLAKDRKTQEQQNNNQMEFKF